MQDPFRRVPLAAGWRGARGKAGDASRRRLRELKEFLVDWMHSCRERQ